MQIPAVSEYNKDQGEQPKLKSEDPPKPVTAKPTQSRPPIINKINKQDSTKIFETNNLPITKGTPKHPTPPEDILGK